MNTDKIKIRPRGVESSCIDRYEAKEQYAQQVGYNTARDAVKRGVLTEEQCSVLMWLRTIRHELSIDIDKPEILLDPDGNSFFHEIMDEDRFPARFRKAGLPVPDLGYSTLDIPTSEDWYYCMTPEEQAEYHDDIYEWFAAASMQIAEIAADVNNKLKSYLKMIDREKGTCFAPTGAEGYRRMVEEL